MKDGSNKKGVSLEEENRRLKEILRQNYESTILIKENYNKLILEVNKEIENYSNDSCEEKINKLERQLEAVKKENIIIKRRYNALKNSKLGKMTIKYWKLKKKICGEKNE